MRRPAIYEAKSTATVADILELAGGLTPDADTSKTVLTRIDEVRGRTVLQGRFNGAGRQSAACSQW